MMIGVIAWRELRAMFLSPLAWAILAVVQFLLASQFFKLLSDFLENQGNAAMPGSAGVTEAVASPLLGYAGVVLLFSAPMLTSRSIAEERRFGTLTLLYAAPVSMLEIVLGKYLGLLSFFLLTIAIAALMPLALLVGGHLDFGAFAAAILGLSLLVAAFAALGLFISALTRQPTLAGMLTFGVLLWLWLVDWTSRSTGMWNALTAYLSIGRHFVSLLKGKFESQDVVYYLLFCVLFLALTVWRLDADRMPR